MFGNSGTRPFREVASEAETPKRSSSGVTQDQTQAVPSKFAALEPLGNALTEVQTATDRSAGLVHMVVQLQEVQSDQPLLYASHQHLMLANLFVHAIAHAFAVS